MKALRTVAGSRAFARSCETALGGRANRLIVFGIAVIVACLTPSTFWNGARATELQFSPSQCATDPQGKVYLALGQIVLRVPLDGLTYILNLSQVRRAAAPQVPDPNEPEGCPDHPIQASAFTLRAPIAELLGEGGNADGAWPPYVVFRLVWVPSDEWGLQPWAEKKFVKRCEAFGVWEELENGLVACRVRFEDSPELNQTSAISYQARPEVYSAHFDRPFVITCSHLLEIGTQTCHIVYKLYRTVNFVRTFDLQRVDVADMVDVDRALRTWIENARVHAFEWPDTAKSQHPNPNEGEVE